MKKEQGTTVLERGTEVIGVIRNGNAVVETAALQRAGLKPWVLGQRSWVRGLRSEVRVRELGLTPHLQDLRPQRQCAATGSSAALPAGGTMTVDRLPSAAIF